MASMSVSGVVSGMDWESMIDSIIEAAAKPAQVKVNKKTNLTNKKSLLEEMKVTMNSIQSSLSPLKLPSTYKAKEIEIERTDTTGSYKGVLTATVNADAEVSVHDIVVKQLARAQVNRSKQITASNLKSTISGLSGKQIYVNAAGQQIGIEVKEDDSLQSLKSRINTALKTTGSGINITASVVDNRLIFKSDNTGLGTNTVSGTLKNTYNTGGVSSLKDVVTNSATGATTDIYVSDDNVDRLKVSSGGKTYSIHQDYEVVNGEIRWKQYKDTNEIKLGDKVSATYEMAAGDSFTTGTIKRGSGDSDTVNFGFTVKDNGTLSQRMTITGTHSDTETTTEYGGSGDGTTDTTTTTSTSEDGKIRTTTTVTTLETTDKDEDGDTINVIKTTTTTVTETDYTYGEDFVYKDGKVQWLKKEAETNEPDEYTVSFTKDNSIDYNAIEDADKATTTKTTSNEPAFYKVSFERETTGNYTADVTKSYNEVTTDVEPENYTISITKTITADDSKTGITRGLQTVTTTKEPASYSLKVTTSATSTEYSGQVNASDNDKTLAKIFGVEIDHADYENIKIKGYTYDTDYTVEFDSDGEAYIKWLETAVPTGDDEIDFSSINTAYNTATGHDFNTITLTGSDGIIRTYIDPDDASQLTITDGTNTYEYGRDFVIRVSDDGTGYNVSWFAANTGDTAKEAQIAVTTYAQAKNISTSGFIPAPAQNATYDINFSYSKDNTETQNVTKDGTVKNVGTGYTNVTITGSDGTPYVNGTDYWIDGTGDITWNSTTSQINALDDRNVFDFDSFNTEYNNAYGHDVSTITLTGSDGVIRTYLDPEDPSQLTITNGTKTYEYGRDFVVRVDDDGEGYNVSWLITGDVDISEANTAVTTYAAYKNISTSGFQAAPDSGEDYTINFSHTQTNSFTADVNSTDSNKNITSLLSSAGLTTSDYENITITDSNGKEYSYVDDVGYLDEDYFTIDDAGNIVWYTEDEEVRANEDAIALDFDELNELYKTATSKELSFVNLTDSNGVTRTYLDIDSGYASLFSMTSTDEDDNEITYEYGRDYVIRLNDTEDGYMVSWLVSEDNNGDGVFNINDANAAVTTYATYKNISLIDYEQAPEVGKSFTLNFSKEIIDTTTKNVKAADEDKSLETIFGDDFDDEIDVEDYVIKSKDGKTTYTYGTDADFYIEDGEIKWVKHETYTPLGPAQGDTYTVTYNSFEALKAKSTYEGDDEMDLTFTVDDGWGDIDGTKLSYEQFKKQLALSDDADESDIAEAFEKYFTLTDSDGKTYTYGTDFTIEAGADVSEDSDGSLHMPIIKWTTSGTRPAYDAELTMTYTGKGEGGGELFELTDSITRTNSDVVMSGISGSPSYSDFENGTTTITMGTKTYYENVDFEIGQNDAGNVTINWKTGTNYEWYYPTPSSTYTVNLVTEDGEAKTYSGARDNEDVLDLRDYGFNSVNGALTKIKYNGTTYDLTITHDEDEGEESQSTTPTDVLKNTLGLEVKKGTNGVTNIYKFDWLTPTERTANTNLPNYGDEITIEYEYDENTFSLSDDADGALLAALELDKEDEEHYTAAQDAILLLDDNEITRSSNDIGESYSNEIGDLKGVTLHLKGVGEVSIDISHDAQKAVEGIQTLVENYNSLMTWMNTRMTESQVDKDTAATIDSDDFRMRWGLLHGSSLLRNTKSQMRSIVSQNYTFSFTQRTSAEEIYGDMAFNGLKSSSTLRLRIGSTYSDITIEPTDTLETIAAKINDDTVTSLAKNMHYDEAGKKREQPLLKATVENDKLVISSTSSDEITMSGSAAMNALKMNYTYKGVYQLGISTTSDDYGKSGELEFDTEKFMEALEDNPDETQELMLKFVTEMDSWCKTMLTASGDSKGILTREIDNIQNQIDTINEYLEKYQERLDRQEETLRSKYAAAESQISKLSQQATAMASILQQLNGSNNNNNNYTASTS